LFHTCQSSFIFSALHLSCFCPALPFPYHFIRQRQFLFYHISRLFSIDKSQLFVPNYKRGSRDKIVDQEAKSKYNTSKK